MSATPLLLAEIEKVRPPYNINVLTAAAAEFLLDHMSVFDEQAQQLCVEREVLTRELQNIEKVDVFPSKANFILIKLGNSEQIFKKLLDRRILVKNVGKMHPLLTGCLRVTVSTPAENQLFIDALRDALSS
jgi:histidinol-phosphate aminotransferase